MLKQQLEIFKNEEVDTYLLTKKGKKQERRIGI